MTVAARARRLPVPVAVFLVLTLLGAPHALAVADVQPARVGGATRIDTAAEIARLAFPGGAEGAIVATSVDFADALSASALAGVVGQPVLLTDPFELPEATADVLADLRVEVVTIVGGPLAVSDDVQEELERNYAVERLAGQRRYDTSAEIARKAVELNDGVGTLDGRTTVFVASGRVFADALAGSSLAYAGRHPLVLTEQEALPPASVALLDELDPDQAIILGGPVAVSSDVEQALQERGVGTIRVFGAERTETAARVADLAFQSFGFAGNQPLLARGDAFPDALTAGPLGGEQRVPILLASAPNALGPPTRQWFADNCPLIEVVRAVGGPAALSVETLEDAEDAAESCGDDDTDTRGRDFVLEPQQVLAGMPGDTFDLRLRNRFDDAPLPDTVDIALYPCVGADVTGGEVDTFTDADGDGDADGLGATDMGKAAITTLNGQDIEDDAILYDAVVRNGEVTLQVASAAEDCTVPVVWTDANDDGELDVDADGQPTEDYGLGQLVWSEGGTSSDTRGRTYVLEPQEVRMGAPGDAFDYTVSRRFDGEALPETLDIALFPCASADVTGGDFDTFTDSDADGTADGLGTTDTGNAAIAILNGEDIEDQRVLYNAAVDDGDVTFSVASQSADCTVPLVWTDADADGLLDVDTDGRPTEIYGVGKASWA